MKKIIVVMGVALGFVFSGAIFANEPSNIGLLKLSAARYYDSGEYDTDINRVVGQALSYLQERVSETKYSAATKPLAIVLDIDETALSNYPDIKTLDFGGSNQEITEREAVGEDSAIKPTLALYQYAKQHHVAVFFVTGRLERYRNVTQQNLIAAGYDHYDGLIFKPSDYHEDSAVPYKSSARRDIEHNGYDILLSMGDQESDLKGGFADKTFKLPNPFYYIN